MKHTTIKELKEAWLKAKIAALDFRGLGSARFKFAKAPEHIAALLFYSISPKEGLRYELEMNIDDGSYCWTWKDLLKEIATEPGEVLKINFTVNIWNKARTDAERKDISSFIFIKKLKP